MIPVLTLTTFTPLAGALVILLLPRESERKAGMIAAVASGLALLFSIVALNAFDAGSPNLQLVEDIPWITSLNVRYTMGVDGLSMLMVILTTLLSFLAVVNSFNIEKQVKGYYSLFLLLQTSMTGVFMAQDLFLFYVFWELMLLPMYFLIGIWGAPSRVDPDGRTRGGPYAAIKFFLYTLVGSVLMLVAMAFIWTRTGTFDMRVITDLGRHGLAPWGLGAAVVLWALFFISFAIKIPMFPFHTWLPDAHVEAPTPVSVILAGVLLKMGTYGILRINYGFFPRATALAAGTVAALGLINILYGALCAMAQTDMKRLVAYSSISHMGYVLLGMSAFYIVNPGGGPAGVSLEGTSGAVFQMFSHGIITAMLFMLVGVIYDRAHHRWIDRFGGLAITMPIYFGFVLLAFFASLGLPGLSGFVAEAMVIFGAWSVPLTRYLVIGVAAGIVITAAYHLWLIQRAFLGNENPEYKDLPEISPREVFCLFPLVVLTIFVGIYPGPVLSLIEPSLSSIIHAVVAASGGLLP